MTAASVARERPSMDRPCAGRVRRLRRRCPPAPRCWRPAPAPARRTPSPRWPPATSPRAAPGWPSCMLVTFGRAATQELRERVRERLVDAPSARWPTRRGRGRRADRCSALLAERRRRRGRRCAGPARRGAGRVRRGHHRHHPPVLPADARPGSAWPATPTRTRSSSRRSTTWSRGGRRPLRAQVRRPRRRRPGVRPVPRRCALARARGRATGRPGWSRPTPSRDTAADARRRFAAAVRGRGGAAQAAARPVRLRRPAHPAARRAGRPDAAAARAPAARPVPGGAGRRVPGHRPGAVGHPAARLPRARHAGADRRPEAGDLRLPRRRRDQLPGRPPGTPTPHATLDPQLAQRRRRCCGALDTVFGGAALGDPRIVVRPVEPPHPGRGCAGAPVAAPVRLRGAGPRRAAAGSRRGLAVDRGRRRDGRPRRRPPTSPRCSPVRGDGRRAPAGAARRRRGAGAHQRPGRRWSGTRSPAAACPAVLVRHRERVRHPGGARLADPAGGAGAAAPRRGSRAAALTCFLGLDRRRAGWPRRRRRCSTSSARPLRDWAAVLHRSAGSRRCWRRSPPATGLPRAAARRAPTASGG